MKGREGTAPAVRPLLEVEGPEQAQPSERINYHVAMGQQHGRLALAHLLCAGWELARQKQTMGYGAWAAWCGRNLEISKDTADRYIQLYAKTVGVRRADDRVPLERRLTRRELEEATVGMEGKTATRAMVDLGIVRRNPNHGGARPGAGRPVKDAAGDVALEPALWAAARGALDGLVRLDAERDFLHRLSDDHLAAAAQALLDLSAKASRALTARIAQPPPQPPET